MPLISIRLAHLAQLNFQIAIIIKQALKLQAWVNIRGYLLSLLSPVENNVWNKILKKTELESQTP